MAFSRQLDALFAGADRLVVAQRIGDAEHGEAIDDQPALVAENHLLAWRYEIEQAPVELDHGLHERNLGVQARVFDHPHGTAELR